MGRTLRILRWLYMGRLVLATAIFIAAVAAWSDATAEQTLVATLALLSAIGVTMAGVWWTLVLRRPPGTNFLYIQLLYDTVLVTAVVHITHALPPAGYPVGSETVLSPYAPLYVPVIAVASLLLPLRGGMLIGVLASVLYFADVLAVAAQASRFAPLETVQAALQVGLFVIVAVATATLGDRLRRTGTALGAVESELRQLRVDLEEMLGAIDTGLITVDGGGRLAHVNDSARALLRLGQETWLGRPVLEVLDRTAPGLGTVIRRTAATGVPVRRHEIRQRRAEGDRYLGVRTTVLERSGDPWVTAVVQDITDGKQIEDLLRRAERLQAVAELGASLAHEIRNPLASIRSATEQLAGDHLPAEDRQVLSRLVVGESERLSRLLSEFMEYSRVEMRRWGVVDLARVAREAVELVNRHPDRAADARVELVDSPDVLEVDGDPDLLHRALFNLVLNAVQHCGPAGRVRVDLAEMAAVDLPPSVQLDSPVRLRVQDTGPGIAEEDVARLFDPFYSKRHGGTGLGLALVHRAVEAHRGAILVEGNEGTGACFTVYLPGHIGRGVENG